MNTPSQFKRPQSVLFVCTFNAVRSPMAEAIARKNFGTRVFVQSAGVKIGELNPFAVSVMAEIDCDISHHTVRTFSDLDDISFDMIVTLSPEAHHSALEYCRSLAIDVEYWPTIDPTAFKGSRDQRLIAYRETRDKLAHRIGKLLGSADHTPSR